MSTKSKIQFNIPVIDFYGEAVKMPDSSKEPVGFTSDARGNSVPRYPEAELPLMKACTNALGGQYQGEEQMSQEAKQKRWRIACKIAKAKINGTGEVTLKPDEITETLVCTGKAFPPFIAGYIQALLNPSDEDEKLVESLGKQEAPPEAKVE